MSESVQLAAPCGADVTLSRHDATLESIPHAPNRAGRLYARNSRFKRQGGWAAAFFVYRDGALALDSCTVKDSDIESGKRSECRLEQPPRFCRYSDGSPYTGIYV
jgi:hypothetical protein